MPACLKCGSERVIEGHIQKTGRGWNSVFRPNSIRWFCFSFFGGVLLDDKAFACRDCGLIWTAVPRDVLRKFVDKHCDEP